MFSAVRSERVDLTIGKAGKITALVIAALVMSSATFAQGAGGVGSGGATGGSAGTNSAGTANASGGKPGMAAGVGPGAESIDGTPTGNASVDAQDRAVDRKVKSICKGC